MHAFAPLVVRVPVAMVMLVACGGVERGHYTLPGPSIAPLDRSAAAIAYDQATVAEMREDWAQALESFERAYQNMPHPMTLLRIARALLVLGRGEDAIDALDLMAEHFSPVPADAARDAAELRRWIDRGGDDIYQFGDRTVADRAETPERREARNAAADAWEEAVAAGRDARWAEVLEHYRRAYGLSPHPATSLAIATTLHELGRDDEARATLDSVEAEFSPLPPRVRIGVADVREQIEFGAEAVAGARRALSAGRLASRQHDWEEARLQYLSAHELTPTARVALSLAESLRALGRHDEALAALAGLGVDSETIWPDVAAEVETLRRSILRGREFCAGVSLEVPAAPSREPSVEEATRGQSAYEAGVAAARRGEILEAFAHMRAAYELSGRDEALVVMSRTLEILGRQAEAAAMTRAVDERVRPSHGDRFQKWILVVRADSGL